MHRISKLLGVGAGVATGLYATYAASTWLRYRRPWMSIAAPALAAVHAFIERKQLRTLGHHAEHVEAVPVQTTPS